MKYTATRVFNGIRHRAFGKIHPFFLKLASPIVVLYMPSLLHMLVGSSAISLDDKWHKMLPSKKRRLAYKESFLEDFDCVNISAPKFNEVNLIFRGDVNFDNIKKNIPTLFLNPINEDRLKGFNQVYFITADIGVLSSFFTGDNIYCNRTKAQNVIFIRGDFFVDEGGRFNISNASNVDKYANDLEQKWFLKNKIDVKMDYHTCVVSHRSRMKNIQLGSATGSIVYALQNSKKVNIYGWDQYLEEALPKSALKQVFSLWSYGSRVGTFATNLINWIYAYRILNELSGNKIVIEGRINQIRDMHWLKEKSLQIMYKNFH